MIFAKVVERSKKKNEKKTKKRSADRYDGKKKQRSI